ncbi:hypothetical protein L4C37_22055 [Vibrio kagoshimensis]|uniref:DUF2971 domain-containing protein n=1 Tax=Vibrio kagoshimensis TaxID=2910244 RepID=UPI003D1DBA65
MAYRDTLNIPEDKLDREIFRIMPIDRLLEIFTDNKLTLVKPKLWDDPFENMLLNGFAKTSEGELVDFVPMRESVYGQCWTLHSETDAMWRIYSHDKQGAKVKTTIRKLLEALQSKSGQYARVQCFIGEVQYAKTQKALVETLQNIDLFNTSGSGTPESLMHKRNEFNHEREVRLIYTGGGKLDIHQFSIDPHELFDEIVFDPRINDHLFDAYKTALEAKNFKKSIRKSVMYKPPKALMVNI